MSNNWKHKNSTKNRYLKPCPDCGINGLELITQNKEINGVIYSKRYWCCGSCGFRKEYRVKGENTKLVFDGI